MDLEVPRSSRGGGTIYHKDHVAGFKGSDAASLSGRRRVNRPSSRCWLTLSVAHLLNDTVQSLLPAVYPILKQTFRLSFSQVGLITLAFQLTASLLQPFVGLYTDRNPKPYSLPLGMGVTLCGLLLLAFANHFFVVLIAAALIGVGSSVFHPEVLARRAHGLGRPARPGAIPVPGRRQCRRGDRAAARRLFRRAAWAESHSLARAPSARRHLLSSIGSAAGTRHAWRPCRAGRRAVAPSHGLTRKHVAVSVAVLLALVFSKFVYLASLTSYYTFYLIEKFHLTVQAAQLCLFVFLFASALGTIFGGPIGDRIGRRYVIWGSILGVLPFTLRCPT